jgi:hypothetical protein
MQRKSQGPPEPLSTHSSIQILAKENSLPEVRAYWSVGADAGELSGVLFLTVEAEHRTAEFDHTASFTISGTPTAVDRVLLALRAAYAAQIEPLLGECHRRPHRVPRTPTRVSRPRRNYARLGGASLSDAIARR